MRDSFPNIIYLCNEGIGCLETCTLLMVTKETVNTIKTGEFLHHVEQEATVVTCRRPKCEDR